MVCEAAINDEVLRKHRKKQPIHLDRLFCWKKENRSALAELQEPGAAPAKHPVTSSLSI